MAIGDGPDRDDGPRDLADALNSLIKLPRTGRVQKVLVISSGSEGVHMNCPHVRSEIFAPHADEKGTQWADELSVCHARTLTVGLARSNFSLIGGMLGARLGPPAVQLVFE